MRSTSPRSDPAGIDANHVTSVSCVPPPGGATWIQRIPGTDATAMCSTAISTPPLTVTPPRCACRPNDGFSMLAVLPPCGPRDNRRVGGSALFTLPALRRARDLMDRDYALPLDLDAMARTAGYSKYYFARGFAAAYGETPAAYLTRRRVERAKSLL